MTNGSEVNPIYRTWIMRVCIGGERTEFQSVIARAVFHMKNNQNNFNINFQFWGRQIFTKCREGKHSVEHMI
jgi:hypothetical protein